MVDGNGNLVPIDAIRATQDGRPITCTLDPFAAEVILPVATVGGWPGLPAAESDAQSEAAFAHYHPDCSTATAGLVDVVVVANGATMSQQVALERRPSSEAKCPTYFPPTEATLALPGEACPTPSGIAVSGSFVARDGTPGTGNLTADIGVGKPVDCTISDGAFECPALTPYPATYLLRGMLGSTELYTPVTVAAEFCAPSTAEISFDLEAVGCGDQPPAIASDISVAGEKPLVPVVRARVRGGDEHACDIQELENEPQSATKFTRFAYSCAAQTSTGGGDYTLEVTVGDEHVSREVTVSDNGCSPRTQNPSFPVFAN